MKGTLLVVEDGPSMREALVDHLSTRYRWVLAAGTIAEARAIAQTHGLDGVVLDLHLPDGEGLDFLTELHEIAAEVPVVVVTAFPEVEAAVRSFRGGAHDFLQKPFSLTELDRTLDRAVFRRIGIEQGPVCVPPCAHDGPKCKGHARISGSSECVQRLREEIRRASRVPGMPVLVQGESGTGKDLVASAIHFESKRCKNPYVAVNCSALPSSLAEAELFGHAKGSFTGAHQDRAGLFEQANNGTLFLDEIGDLPLALQPKLLRALETGEIRRVGDTRTRPISIRVIAATNRDLLAMVGEGTFREDLYYRLAVFKMAVPPLRDRQGDLEELSTDLLRGIQKESGLGVRWLDEGALERMRAYAWPGNVRQLRNVLYQAAASASDGTIRLDDLPVLEGRDGAPSDNPEPTSSLKDANLAHIASIYDACNHNKSETARRLGITRVTLRARLAELGLA